MVLDPGSSPGTSTKSILGLGHDRDNAKRLLSVKDPIKMLTNILLTGVNMVSTGSQVSKWTARECETR